MSNPWFRLYAEMLHDHKVQMMPETYRWRLVALMCIRCSNDVETLQDEEISFQLRITPEEWCNTKKHFIEKKFIDCNNKLLNWNKRQFLSDSSTARVRRHREAKKKIKKQECNVTVTPPESDTESESDKDNKEILPNGSTKKKTKLPNYFCVTDAHRELAKKNGWPPPDDEFEAFCDHHIAKGNKFADWDRAFYTWLRNSKTRFPKIPTSKINHELQAQIKNIYSEILPNCCPVNYWPSEAAANLQARIDENPKYQAVAGWREFFAYVTESKKLTGKVNMRDGTKFKLTLSYLVKEKTFSDVCNSAWHEPDEETAFANKQRGET